MRRARKRKVFRALHKHILINAAPIMLGLATGFLLQELVKMLGKLDVEQLPQHPEALEARTPVDERQEGRSEVVREVATPRAN